MAQPTAPPMNFGPIAQMYDAELGPVVFTPYAADLCKQVAALTPPPERVLELAAGTGRLTGPLHNVLPASSSLVSTDLSEAMLEVAKRMVPDPSIKWQACDMQALPFDAASFDLVIIQFGLMLVPQQLQALKEIKRVLAPGGTLMFSVWGTPENNPMFMTSISTISSHLPVEQAQKLANMGKFAHSCADPSAVSAMLSEAGFSSASHYTHAETITDTAALARGMVFGSPMAAFLNDSKAEVAAKVQAAFGPKIACEALVFSATA